MSRFRHISARHFARTIFALAGALLLVVIAGENSARAGCGDYVFIRDSSGRLVRASTLMARHGGQHVCTGLGCQDNQKADFEPEPQQPSPPAKPPCDGPNCSGNSQQPAPLPPPAPQRTSHESTVLLLKSAAEDCPTGQFEYAAVEREHELHYPQSIFHPPR